MLTHTASRRVLPLGTSPDPQSDVSQVKTCQNSVDSSKKDRTPDNDSTSDNCVPIYGNSEEIIVSPSSQALYLQQPRRSSLRSTDRQGDSTRSVRFSTVQTRVFEVIEVDKNDKLDGFNVSGQELLNIMEEKLAHDYGDDERKVSSDRCNLGWRFADRVRDVETHQAELEKERKAEYTRMIQNHIQRVEREKMEHELDRQRQKQRKEQKGFKSRVLKPLWKGFIEASSRSAFTISPVHF
jgi:hypothetical protein